MGAPDSSMKAADRPDADTLLGGFRTIKVEDRARHASVLSYWLSIRAGKDTPALQDLDPLQISDAGPFSLLLELVGGGQDAEIRHIGDALKGEAAIQRIIDAPNPSVLNCIARKLPIVSISRDFLAFEDSFDGADGPARCWVTLLPLTSCGAWVDYVYAFVTVEAGDRTAAQAPAPSEPTSIEPTATERTATERTATEPTNAAEATPMVEVDELGEAIAEAPEPEAQPELQAEPEPEPEIEEVVAVEAPVTKAVPGFAKLIDGFANLAGFYGQGVKAEPVMKIDIPPVEPTPAPPPVAEPEASEPPLELDEVVADSVAPESVAIEPPVEDLPVEIEPESEPEPEQIDLAPQPAPDMEGALLTKLSEVRAMADEARLAQLRATAALHGGLSAAYDFAIDAEASPEEYLRLVEAEGMKIQLRAPMAPVVKLAFNGLADDTTIADLETILAWALKQELPRGALAQKIEEAGGIDALLDQTKTAA